MEIWVRVFINNDKIHISPYLVESSYFLLFLYNTNIIYDIIHDSGLVEIRIVGGDQLEKV